MNMSRREFAAGVSALSLTTVVGCGGQESSFDVAGLFRPAMLGNVAVPNHFVRSATWEGVAKDDGTPTPEVGDIYVKLAAGGIGTIITGSSRIAAYEQNLKNQFGVYDDRFVEAYRPIVERVHAAGAKIALQIVHGSSASQAHPETARVLGPSAIPHPGTGIVPKEMTKDDISDVVSLFAKAAARTKAAGFDAVQLHGAHGFLLSQFMSPLFNRRTDEYGGNLENRFRILRDVTSAVRAEVGPDYPVWMKINSSDEKPGGLTVDDFLIGAKGVADCGIDCFEVTGNDWPSHPRGEENYYRNAATRLAETFGPSVILTGGVRSVGGIADVCANSGVRFFGMARPLIPNPAYVNGLKARI